MAKKVTIKSTSEQIELLLERVQVFNKANKTAYEVGFKGRFCYK